MSAQPTTLSPLTTRKERKGLDAIIAKVVRCAVGQRNANDLLVEVYLAGLWHGSLLREERP